MNVDWVFPPRIRWVCDRQQTLVIDSQSGAVHTLRQTQAAVWGWLNLEYGHAQLVEFLATLLEITPEQAETELLAMLDEWQAAGLFERKAVKHG